MEAIVEILLKRAEDPGQELLKLLQDPFANQVSIWP